MNTLQNLKKQIAKIREQKDPIIKQFETKIQAQEQMIKKLTQKLIHFQDRQMCNRISYLDNSGYIWKLQDGQKSRKFIVIDVSSLQPQSTFISNSSVKFIKYFEAYLFNKSNNSDGHSNIENQHFQKFIQQIQTLQSVVTRLRTQMDELKKKYQEDIHQGFAIVNPNSRAKTNLCKIPTLSTPDIMAKQTFSFNSEEKKQKQSFDLGITQINSHTMKQQTNSLHLSNQEIDKNTLIKQSSLPPSPNSDQMAHNFKSKIGGSDELRNQIVEQQQQSDQQSKRISKNRKSKKKQQQVKQEQQKQAQIISNGYYGQLKPKSKIKKVQNDNIEVNGKNKQLEKQQQKQASRKQQQQLKLTGYIEPITFDGLKTKKIQKKQSQNFTGLQTQRIEPQKIKTQDNKQVQSPIQNIKEQNNIVLEKQQKDLIKQQNNLKSQELVNKEETKNLQKQSQLNQNKVQVTEQDETAKQKAEQKINSKQQDLKPYLKQLPREETKQVAFPKQQLKQQRQINIEQNKQASQNKAKQVENQTSIQSSIAINNQKKSDQIESKQSSQAKNRQSLPANKLLDEIQVKIPQQQTKSAQVVASEENGENVKQQKRQSQNKDAIKWIDSNLQMKSLTASPQLHPFLINQNSSIQLKLNKIPSQKQQKEKLQNFNLNIPQMKSIQQIDEQPISEDQIKSSSKGVAQNIKDISMQESVQVKNNKQAQADKQTQQAHQQVNNQNDLTKATILPTPQNKPTQVFVPKIQNNYVSQLSEIEQLSSNSVASKIQSMNQQLQNIKKNANDADSETQVKNQVLSSQKQGSTEAIPIKLIKEGERKSQTISANQILQMKDIDKKHSMVQIPNKNKQMLSSIKQVKEKQETNKSADQIQLQKSEKQNNIQKQNQQLQKNKNKQIFQSKQVSQPKQQNNKNISQIQQNQVKEQQKQQHAKQIKQNKPQKAKTLIQNSNDQTQHIQPKIVINEINDQSKSQNSNQLKKDIPQHQRQNQQQIVKNNNIQQKDLITKQRQAKSTNNEGTTKQNNNEGTTKQNNNEGTTKQNTNNIQEQKKQKEIKQIVKDIIQTTKQQDKKQQKVESKKNQQPLWSSLFPTYIHNDQSAKKAQDIQKANTQQIQKKVQMQKAQQIEKKNIDQGISGNKAQTKQNKQQYHITQPIINEQNKKVDAASQKQSNQAVQQKQEGKYENKKEVKQEKQEDFEKLKKQAKQAQIEQQQQLDRLLQQINEQQNRQKIKRQSIEQQNQGMHFSHRSKSAKKDEGLNEQIKSLFNLKSQDKSHTSSRKESNTGNDQKEQNIGNKTTPKQLDKINQQIPPSSPVKYQISDRFGLQNSTQYIRPGSDQEENEESKTPSGLYNFRSLKSEPYQIDAEKNKAFLNQQHKNQSPQLKAKSPQQKQIKTTQQKVPEIHLQQKQQKDKAKQIQQKIQPVNHELAEHKTANTVENTTPLKENPIQNEEVNKTPISKLEVQNQKKPEQKEQTHNLATPPPKTNDLKSQEKKKSKSKVIYFRKG